VRPLRHPEWAVRCSWCGASPGNRCTRPSGGTLAIPSHDARITAWTTHLAAQKARQTGDTE
jgi:hypothetical protein